MAKSSLLSELGLYAIAASLAIFLPTVSNAQSDGDAYKQIATVISQRSSNPIVLLHPGLFIQPIYDSADRDEQESYVSFYNRMLKFSLLYAPSQDDLASLYSSILTSAQWALVPLVPAQLQELATLNQLMYTDGNGTKTPGYARYLQKKKTYDEVRTRYDNTPEQNRTPELENELQTASDDLDLAGHRAVYEPAEARAKLLNALKSMQWRTDDIQKLNASGVSSSTGTHWLQTETRPKLDDADQAAWTTITLAGAGLRESHAAPKLASTITEQNVVWWSWKGSTPANSDCAQHLPTGDFSLQFDVYILHVNRQWFDPQLFESQAWRWTNSNALLSDGGDDGNTGTSPMFADAIVLARNLSISGDAVTACRSDIRQAVQNHQEIGFGPFRLAGPNLEPSSPYISAAATTRTIYVPYVQILGVEAVILPKSPNPNPNFQWPTN